MWAPGKLMNRLTVLWGASPLTLSCDAAQAYQGARGWEALDHSQKAENARSETALDHSQKPRMQDPKLHLIIVKRLRTQLLNNANCLNQNVDTDHQHARN